MKGQTATLRRECGGLYSVELVTPAKQFDQPPTKSRNGTCPRVSKIESASFFFFRTH